MTTYSEQTVSCAVCGEPNQVLALASSSSFGPMDLDTRPAELMRSTLGSQIHRCTRCDYCAPSLDEAPPTARRTVESESYRALVEDRTLPELANRFLCWAEILAGEGDPNQAGWATVHAAWACDDREHLEGARDCRKLALIHFEADKPDPTTAAVMCDLLRRTGQFKQADEAAAAALAGELPDVIRTVLLYQRALIARQDMGCHTVGEAAGHGT